MPDLNRRLLVLATCAGMACATAVLAAPEQAIHWAFQSVSPTAPPEVRQSDWIRNEVDAFILARLEDRGLTPAPPATREHFIRRVTLDLVGLPPSPAEVAAFLEDTSPKAYERLIDRLLASPQYGERWARHWLDLVRYAESDGFEHDTLRPHAWRYRDYVIRSFNEDKPYNRFILEQVAGDLLWPDQPDAWIATAFNLLGPDMVDSADQVQRRLNTLNDATDTTASVFLGLTLGCARCHDHKFEPLTQRDYFSLQAFFASSHFQYDRPVPTPMERDAFESAMAEFRARAGATQKEIEALEAPYRQALYQEKLSKLSEDARLAHQTPADQRTMEQENTVRETGPHLIIKPDELAETLAETDRARWQSLSAALRRIPKPAPLPATMALETTNGIPAKTFVLIRGDYTQPGDEVGPAFPAILATPRSGTGLGIEGEGHEPMRERDRAALAQWIASPENPLTARVVVNRLWQHHFGRGLVMTPSDFGLRGAAPTHPELLDWLAAQLVARDWSLKAMHKLILMSAAFRQSSVASPEALDRDPENQLFSRQNRIRLEGEAIRDSLLAISGRLDFEMGGPSVMPPIPSDITKVSKNWTVSDQPEDHVRRSIYILARRNLRFPFLEVFDAPDSNQTCPARGASTTAPQSLTLLNSEEVMMAARRTADRVREAFASARDRIDYAFRLTLGRSPSPEEAAMAREFVRARYRAEEVDAPADAEGDYSELCRALFNLNSFVYVD